jgi:hypothetical protein
MHDFEAQTEYVLSPVFGSALMTCVKPKVRKARDLRTRRFKQQPDPVLIWNLRAVYLGLENEPFGIYLEVTLPAADPLSSITSRFSSHSCGPRGLRVHDTCAGLRVSTTPPPQALAQRCVQHLPDSVDSPSPEVVVDGLPRRIFLRKHAPLAAALQHIEDGVKDLAWAV